MSATQIQPDSDRYGSGFTRLVTVESAPGGVDGFPSSISPERGRRLCEELERGCILLFLRTPFAFTPEEREFLLTRKQTSAGYHKNIAYRPAEDRLTGLDKSLAAEAGRFRSILRNYSDSAARFIAALPRVRALGFDAPFVRTWMMYLAFSEAAFAERTLGDHQLVFAR